MHTNPLLNTSKHFDLAVPFEEIKTDHFLPALEHALTEARTNIEKIKANSESPDFKNTIEALESASETLEYVANVFFNMLGSHGSPEHHVLAKEISPKMADFSSDVNLDPVLFARIERVYENRKSEFLNKEQERLLEKYYKDFVRNGAKLSPSKKEQLRKIDQELSILGPQFSENILKATNAFELFIEKKEDLAGLPETAVEAAAAAASAKDKAGQWLFTLHYPSFLPFITYADSRPLREKIWRAANSKAYKDAYDNQNGVLKTAKLRAERAHILGFKSHAEFVLQERMAQTPDQVFSFLHKLLGPSRMAAERDLAEVKSFKKKLSGSDEIKPWDVGYYSEKLKEEKYKFNAEDLRPYFKLENVINGIFEHAKRLYGLKFIPTTEIPVYHPEVKVYEVRDEKTNEYVSLFYADFFPRETKRGGAWMTTFRDQGYMYGQVRRPHVGIVCNFTKPTPTKPSLLSLDEVETFFHEFGHALHGMLSKCQYRSISGVNVYWDFVELPSQIMENWVSEKESLDLYAHHYETNRPMPEELIQKLKNADKFQAGMMSLRQITFGLLDMAWHTAEPSELKDVDSFEEAATAQTRLLPKEPGTNSSCAFSHIFAGGYSAGYYSYKWAEVLDADAFELFAEKGIFNPDVANRFKEHILSMGGSEHPMELYKKFRGREPDPAALLRRDGLI